MKFIKCEKLEKSMAELQFSIDAEAFKAAPWVLFALGFGLLLSVSGLFSTGEHYKRSAEKQCHSLTVDESQKENAWRGA